MIVVAMTAVGVGSALWSRQRIRRLAELPLRHIELVWIALVIQLVAFELTAPHLPLWSTELLHYVSYALPLAFIVVNRRLPGAWLIAVGASCNLLAIALNGGSMPADMDAWERAGRAPIAPDVFENSKAINDPTLGFLGDIFAVPAGWPLSNVFSIGDVLIVIGATYLAHRWCRSQPVVPTERFELSLTRT